MADRSADAGLGAVSDQRKILIVFRSQSDYSDDIAAGFLIFLEFFNRPLDNVFFRLSTLVLYIKIRSFKVNAEDLCSCRFFLLNFADLLDGLLECIVGLR